MATDETPSTPPVVFLPTDTGRIGGAANPKRLLLAAGLLVLTVLAACLPTLLGVPSRDASIPQSYFWLFYWYVLPGLPFLILLCLTPFPRPFSSHSLVGAAIGAVAAVGIPYFLLWLDSVNYSGGGANIGLGLLILAMPAYLPFLMILGISIARFWHEFSMGKKWRPRGYEL